jgi:hypothetical protein
MIAKYSSATEFGGEARYFTPPNVLRSLSNASKVQQKDNIR